MEARQTSDPFLYNKCDKTNMQTGSVYQPICWFHHFVNNFKHSTHWQSHNINITNSINIIQTRTHDIDIKHQHEIVTPSYDLMHSFTAKIPELQPTLLETTHHSNQLFHVDPSSH